MTKDVILGMLTEKVSHSILDSGDHYGRHYSDNLTIDLANEPASVLKFDTYGADFDDPDSAKHQTWLDKTMEFDSCYHNLYHWLSDRLEYDPKLQEDFDNYCDMEENEDKPYLRLMESYSGEKAINTHNHEEMLSQVIQFVVSDTRVLLQIHNGCDVRGGYTRPKAFTVSHNIDPYSLYSFDSGMLLCKDVWQTENGGYTFESEDHEENLKKFTNRELKVDKDGNGYCPFCNTQLRLYADTY